MGRTSGKQANAAATNQKGAAKKADKTVENMKKSIEMVVKTDAKNNASTGSSSATVDSHVPLASTYEVARDPTGTGTLSTYLNWSDLKKNHNKFYIA